MRHAIYGSLPLVGLLVASVAWGDEPPKVQGDRNLEQAVRDAWIDGKLESAYAFNRHLSAFAIHTDVQNGVVTLTGTVESDIDRDLAEAIAQGLEGVTAVDNRLAVDSDYDYDGEQRAAGEQRSFGQWVNDATTSAAVKAALVRNDNIRARYIDVETRDDVVTLRGEVETEEQKALAEQLAKNTRDVSEVRNELTVRSGG
ncbi:MAG TPA: BON domain-containing protein [Gammaproteobacteria bacterium]